MSEQPTMTLEEAVESLKKSLKRGDELMKGNTWSGGSLKSQAVRVVLDAIEKRAVHETR